MSEHTSGPWSVKETSSATLLIRPNSPQSSLQIEPLADARLIAAAPELLDVAKSAARLLWEIASEVDDGVRTLNEDSVEGKAWAALTDAIAKAEGTS